MLINGRFLTEGSPGFEGFAQHMIAALDRRGELGGARVAVPRGTLPMLPLPATLPVDPAGVFQGAAWEQMDLPRLAGDGWLVNFCGTSPWRRRRQLVVVQDLAALLAPGLLSAWQRRWQLQQLRWQLASAQCVVTLSQAAARALWPLRSASQEIEVLFQPGDHLLRQPADRSVLEPLDLRGRRYVLAVDGRWPGGSSERVEQLMADLALPATLLVVISDRDPSQQAHQAPRAPAADPREQRHVVSPTPAQRRALYEGAACLVYAPAHAASAEPVAEALCCGCPVVATRRAALWEICGDAALYAEPDDLPALASQLRRLLGSTHLARELRAAARERSLDLTWDRAAMLFSLLGQQLAE